MTLGRTLKGFSILAAPLLLAACGGGSGGPGSPGGTSFVGFPIPDSSKVTLNGIAKETSITVDPDTGATTSMAPFTSNPVTADVSVDGDGDINELTIASASGSNTWNTDNSISNETNGVIGAISNDGLKSVLVAAPEVNGFAYQTYGAWETSTQDMTSGKIGVFSVGTQTAAAEVPTTGTATFKGSAGGLYSTGNGDADIMSADATLNADFANKSVGFATSNTESMVTGTVRNDLNLNGTLSYTGGGMTGTVTNLGGTMSGSADGQFYGPNAAEIGGVFALRGTAPGSTEAFGGGFGAKQ